MKKRYGKLKVVQEKGRGSSGHILYKCICDCGETTIVTKSKLISGHTKSCGCLAQDKNARVMRSLPNGYRLWRKYHDIKTRCYNRNCFAYKNYGARGIKMCNKWLKDPLAFYEWAIKSGFDLSLTIDRINVNKGYSPANCRWATKAEQARNRRNSIMYRGKTLKEWSVIFNVDYKATHYRVSKGMSIEQALNEAPNKHEKTS